MQSIKRVSTQIHTRELDRLVAHNNMKRAKLKRVNKHDYTHYQNGFGMIITQKIDSYFSNHWRDYINIPTVDLRRKNA